jgi:hypothetical protein
MHCDTFMEHMAPALDIGDDILAYEAMRADLEAKHIGKWVLFHGRELIAIYDSFELAAEDAVSKFGRGPCDRLVLHH